VAAEDPADPEKEDKKYSDSKIFQSGALTMASAFLLIAALHFTLLI